MKRLYRSTKDRMVAGVLAGIGEYFNIDPTVVRLLFVILLFISFFTVSIVYLVATFIIPSEGEVH
ncbi:PspC domain-containing protein [Virgibacillus sp. MSJ-26]|uniref:PspC domain-containing protein n=1 Tax=Virgibacillus sp. MSJ-26 TaxID=2841522 RepID=UPI001C0FFE73|nr:PspC domain-containing protein [Virgibacillus sp. MSJ-26]MBU5467772.1 PspC domain-containing protein [Virgibacillus sp. MSJ-26]